jgi:hypothetical protein
MMRENFGFISCLTNCSWVYGKLAIGEGGTKGTAPSDCVPRLEETTQPVHDAQKELIILWSRRIVHSRWRAMWARHRAEVVMSFMNKHRGPGSFFAHR